MNKTYRNLILAKIKSVVEHAKAVGGIGNPALKGQLRESLIRDLFRPLLPADIGVGTGEIITSYDKKSKEQDIVIFDKQILPPILLEEKKGIFPVESVLYTIEVKSVLNSSELKKSHASALELFDFKYLTGLHAWGKPVPTDIDRLNSTLFAFSSDLKSNKNEEIKRYNKIRKDDYPALKAICVLNKGYWYWKDNKEWDTFQYDYPYHEVVSFISGIMNSYYLIRETRRNPKFGEYLL